MFFRKEAKITEPFNYYMTGVGLSDKGVPLRLPALLIPGLEAVRSDLSQGIDAHYIVYQATDFIVDTNRLDQHRAYDHALDMKDYMQSFVSEFFPDVRNKVQFYFHNDCPTKTQDIKTVKAALLTIENEDIVKSVQQIKNYSTRHLGDPLDYAAANILLNGGFALSMPFGIQPTSNTTICLVGGKKEEPFFDLSKSMARHSGGLHTIISRLHESIGRMPTYYPCPEGDVLMRDDVMISKLPRRIKTDFEALSIIGATPDRLKSIVKRDIKNHGSFIPRYQNTW